MNTVPLDEQYFQWLYRQVADPEIDDPSLSYWKLLKILYTTRFEWSIPHDENRADDGKALRYEFKDEERPDITDEAWLGIDCSMLELMVGLARRLESMTGNGETHYWFWQMAENIEIGQYSDDRRLQKTRIANILERVVGRTYSSRGDGGFFPLQHANRDQRNVELWYQLNAYVLELDN